MKISLKRCRIALILSLLILAKANAQKLEIGILGGGSYYYGDIVNEWEPQAISYSAGVFARYHLSENMAIKGFFGYCKVVGSDSNSTSEWQQKRNLSFWADIVEGSVQFEYSLVKDITRGRRLRNRVIPYVFAGIGGMYFWNYGPAPVPWSGGGVGSTVPLWGLGDGGVIYNQFAVTLPFGVGVRVKVSQSVNIGFEFGARYTTTSYIDDVAGPSEKFVDPSLLKYDISRKMVYGPSKIEGWAYPGKQRGKIAISDMYFIYGLTLSYRLGLSGGGGYRGKAIRCPRFY
ncbi:MAG: DUF6089 family protein [Bacteroidia bacterium]